MTGREGEEPREGNPREEALELASMVSKGNGGDWSSDVEALEKVLEALTRFLKDLQEPIEKLLRTFLDVFSGDKVGRDVADFYSHLKEAGMPDDLIIDMTKQYFRKRIAMLDLVKALISEIGGGEEEHEHEEEH